MEQPLTQRLGLSPCEVRLVGGQHRLRQGELVRGDQGEPELRSEYMRSSPPSREGDRAEVAGCKTVPRRPTNEVSHTMSTQRDLTVQVIGHEASRTGSPKVLRSLLNWLHSETEWTIDVALLRGGPLCIDYAASVRTLYNLNYYGAKWRISKPEEVLRLLRLDAAMLRARSRRLDRHRVIVRPETDVVFVNSASSLEGLRTGTTTPIVLYLHELAYTVNQSLPGPAAALLTELPVCYIAASQAVADFLTTSKGIAAERITVVNAFVDRQEPPTEAARSDGRHQAGVQDGEKFVLGCGTPAWHKGLDLFLQAAIVLRHLNDNSQIRWVWLGSGAADEEERFRQEVDKAGMQGVVKLQAGVADPAPFFAACDVFVLSSREEAFGLVGLEAAQVGKPIVCFDGSGGMPHFVRQGAGVVVPYLDTYALGSAVGRLLANPDEAVALGRRGQQLVWEQHDPAEACRRIQEVLLTAARRPTWG